MKKLRVVKLNPILKYRLGLWDRYEGKSVEGYENIKNFLSYCGVKEHLSDRKDPEMDSIFPEYAYMSQKQEHHKYVLLEGIKPMGFINFRLDVAKTDKPRMYIQSIAIHPEYQNKGYGTSLMKIILKNPEKYMSHKPKLIYALVDTDNFNCKKLFQKFGKTEVSYSGWDYDYVETELAESHDFQQEKTINKGK